MKRPRTEKRYSVSEDSTAITFLFVLAVLYFLPVHLQGNQQVLSSIDGDAWSQFFYWRRFAYDSLARGELPLWNPYNFSGTPFVAAMQSAIFYPPNLLFLLFDTPFAINLSIALHCLGAGVFTYLFARYVGVSPFGSTLSAVTFAYGAPYFIHIYPGHLPHLSAMWMPLTFLGMEAFLRHKRIRYAIWAAVCLALQILAGYPQYPFYSAVAVSAYFFLHLILRRERNGLPYFLAGYAVFIASALLLAAVQLVPAWELVRNSARGALSFAWVSIFSLPPENLLTMLLPNSFGDIVNVPYWGKNNLWEMSIYFGIVPLAMMGVAVVLNRSRQVMVFAVIAGVFLLLALGKHTPFLWFLYTFVPGFDLFRGVGKAAFVFAFGASIIAGFGLEQIRLLVEKADKKLLRLALVLVIAALLIGIIAFVSSAGDPYAWRALVQAYAAGEEHFEPLPLNDQFFNASWKILWADIWKLFFITLCLSALCFVGRKARSRSPKAILLSILVLAAVDLWHFGSRYLVSFNPRILSMDPELKSFFKAETEPFRIATPLGRLRNHLLNIGMIEGIENVGGYDAIVVKTYSEFINLTQGLPIDQPNLLMGINRISPLLNMLNVKYYVVEPSINIGLPGFDLAFQNSGNKVYRSLNVLPRSFIVHEARIVNDLPEAFRSLVETAFDPTSVVLLAESVDGLSRNPQERSPVPLVREHSPKRVLIDAQPMGAGLLVLADSYYPGWKAFVNGTETKIYSANYTMRAVFLPAGRHRVEFRYDPFSFKVGAAISAAAFIVLIVVLLPGRLMRIWRADRGEG